MSEQFNAGEIAVWQNQVGEFAHLNGTEVLVLSGLEVKSLKRSGICECYEVDLKNEHGANMYALPEELRRRKPPQADSGERAFMADIRKLADKAPQRVGETA